MSPFTDYLGNPINPGDIVIYPTCTGSSSADTNLGRVAEIIPLVPKPGTWLSTGCNSRQPYVREDQQFKRGATEYFPTRYNRLTKQFDQDKSLHYVLRIQRYSGDAWGDKLHFIKNVNRVTVVTSLTSIR